MQQENHERRVECACACAFACATACAPSDGKLPVVSERAMTAVAQCKHSAFTISARRGEGAPSPGAGAAHTRRQTRA